MSALVTNLIALAEGLQARLVTQAEAAERLQVLAGRVPTFVVWAKEMNGQEPVLCYLSTAGRRQDALAEAKRALGPGAAESIRVEVAPARPGVIWKRDKAGKE